MVKGKEVTIYDLADKLNISIATVSRGLKDDPVVSKKTRKKIFELAEEMGYRSNHFARNLRRQKTNTIGIIVHGIYGGFYVRDNNQKIPNKDGVRLDVIEALKKLKIPVLRWPGGCFADTYHWKDGIGPKDKRPSMLNVWWGNVKEDNSFGTNEFLDMAS